MVDGFFAGGGRRWSAVLAATVVMASVLSFVAGATPTPVGAHAGTDHRILAVNLNGPAVEVDGVPFSSNADSPNVALRSGGRTCSSTRPTPDGPGLAQLLQCFVWRNSAGLELSVSGLDAAVVDVYVWVFEDTTSVDFDLLLNGQAVQRVRSGPAGTWQRVGPFAISVQPSGAFDVSASAYGANLSAIEVYESDGSTATLTATRTADGLPRQDWQGAPFIDELVVGGLTQAVSAEFLPDGRMLVLTKRGSVQIVDPGEGTSTQLVQLPNLSTAGERGALDLVASPRFSADKRIYVYYSHSDYTMRIDRLTVGTPTQTAASRTNVYTSPPGKSVEENAWGSHLGGSLNFGPDGYLYVTIGDTATSKYSQELTTPFGKVLRIGADGSIPSDNPFVDGPGPNADEVWAYGLRNPFRASFDAVTGKLWVGDVGGNRHDTAYEEINVVTSGANYGWPLCEGPTTAPKYGVSCPGGVTGPVVYYSHDPSKPTGSNASITGGEIYRGTAYPRLLHGAYIYADFAQREIRYATLSSSTEAASDGILQRVEGRQPTWVGVGPDGLLYYVHFDYSGAKSELRRLRPSGTAGAPPEIITASASPLTGKAPLQVTFAASAADADGTNVTYRWHFGDGTSADGPSPSHTYAGAGTYPSHLEVSSDGQTTRSGTITITVGSPPTASITSPADGARFRAGETITVRGAGNDDEPLPADAMEWEIQFVHEQHAHPVLTSAGSEVTFTVPTDGHSFEGATAYRVTLTVTDADGVATKTSILLEPRKVLVRLESNVPDLAATVDGIAQSLPYDLDSLEGFTHTISAPSSICQGTEWRFASWSGGQAATFILDVPAGFTALTATYTTLGATETCGAPPLPPPPPPPPPPVLLPPPPPPPPPPVLLPPPPPPPLLPPPPPPPPPVLLPPPPPPPPPPVSLAAGPPIAHAVGGALSAGGGVWLGFTNGGLQAAGNAPYLGDASSLRLNAPVVAIAPTADRAGYWMLGQDGGVFSFGNAAFHGSTGDMRLNQPVVSLAAHPKVSGYWFAAADGGVFAFGAPFHGSAGGVRLVQPVVGMAPTTSGNGYWLAASDGGIFSYGDAAFSGSTGNMRLNQPIVGMAADPDGRGYWLVAADGGVFSFDAAFHGSATGQLAAGDRVAGMVAHSPRGYWLITARGGVIGFGSAAGVTRPSA